MIPFRNYLRNILKKFPGTSVWDLLRIFRMLFTKEPPKEFAKEFCKGFPRELSEDLLQKFFIDIS